MLLHAGALNRDVEGGLRDDGEAERYAVDLLDETPEMPAAAEMLRMIAKDSVRPSALLHHQYAPLL